MVTRQGNPADHIDLMKSGCASAHNIYVISSGLSDWKSDRATMRVVLALSTLEVPQLAHHTVLRIIHFGYSRQILFYGYNSSDVL